MASPVDGNGLTNKELLLIVWQEVREVRERVDSLESSRDRSHWPRHFLTVALSSLLSVVIATIVARAA